MIDSYLQQIPIYTRQIASAAKWPSKIYRFFHKKEPNLYRRVSEPRDSLKLCSSAGQVAEVALEHMDFLRPTRIPRFPLDPRNRDSSKTCMYGFPAGTGSPYTGFLNPPLHRGFSGGS
jgi:hypothetical protein